MKKKTSILHMAENRKPRLHEITELQLHSTTLPYARHVMAHYKRCCVVSNGPVAVPWRVYLVEGINAIQNRVIYRILRFLADPYLSTSLHRTKPPLAGPCVHTFAGRKRITSKCNESGVDTLKKFISLLSRVKPNRTYLGMLVTIASSCCREKWEQISYKTKDGISTECSHV